ncbi:ParB N-terminal domain-containing protein [Pelomonas sp. BJYL3]|uniref:ParB N-terminal domain-containing protein n=1 Tax=Pelomonas sp. BJYL3 TaxID=2976697 RepID=UPI0022B34EC0|nr:ParB N-terminal domain-containing protein [Pelomonas sp. BJYL3]
MRAADTRGLRLDCSPPASPGVGAPGYTVALEAIDFFRATEAVDPQRVRELTDSIVASGHWLVPIPVEHRTGLVMDGNHRLRAARLLGLRRLPCIPLDYGDARVDVRCWRSAEPFDIDRILQLAARQAVLPYKTTRHRFDPPLPGSRIPLALLAQELHAAQAWPA